MLDAVTIGEYKNMRQKLEQTLQAVIAEHLNAFTKDTSGKVNYMNVTLTDVSGLADYAKSYLVNVQINIEL
jgi:hypothetical protein